VYTLNLSKKLSYCKLETVYWVAKHQNYPGRDILYSLLMKSYLSQNTQNTTAILFIANHFSLYWELEFYIHTLTRQAMYV